MPEDASKALPQGRVLGEQRLSSEGRMGRRALTPILSSPSLLTGVLTLKAEPRVRPKPGMGNMGSLAGGKRRSPLHPEHALPARS
jgi:hypothetical protein